MCGGHVSKYPASPPLGGWCTRDEEVELAIELSHAVGQRALSSSECANIRRERRQVPHLSLDEPSEVRDPICSCRNSRRDVRDGIVLDAPLRLQPLDEL